MTVFTLLEIISALSFIAMTAYLTARSRFIMRCTRYPFHRASQFTLIVLFAFLAITGNYSTLPWNDQHLPTSLIGVIMAGIAGGPISGFCVGLLCALYMVIVKFSTLPLPLFIIAAGTISGLLRLRFTFYQITPLTGACVALVLELCRITLLILFPDAVAPLSLHFTAAVLTMAVTTAGVWLFLYIINWIEAEQDIYGARAAQLALDIASRTLPFLRLGFNTHSAIITANIVYELAKVDAVSITGRYKRLAFIGQGTDHHKPGEPILSAAVKETITSKTMRVINNPTDRGCPFPHCPLKSSVVVPLFSGDKVIGTIEIARIQETAVSELDIHLADGIANLLSVQIQLAEVDEQRKMREKAELKALRAQINPHFLFNTINIIMSFCRTDPDKARSLLGSLATLMQRGYSNQAEMVTLQEELAAIMAYLEIAMSRFGDRLDIAVNVDGEAGSALVPALSLQPLVENALNHGLFPKLGGCLLSIEAYVEEDDLLIITITDNGVGIPPEKLAKIQAGQSEGLGLSNVHQRLISLYGIKYGLTVTSKPTYGTEARLQIPFQQNVSL